jgi:hypothetical protein
LESRQESILSRLNDLKNQIDAIQGSKLQTGASQGSKISVQVCSNLTTSFLQLNNVIKVKIFFYFGSIFYQEKVEVASSPSVFAEFDLDQQKSVTLKISKLKETLNSIQTVLPNTSSKSVLLIERQLDKSLQ